MPTGTESLYLYLTLLVLIIIYISHFMHVAPLPTGRSKFTIKIWYASVLGNLVIFIYIKLCNGLLVHFIWTSLYKEFGP